MNEIPVYISAEDAVTKEIIVKMLSFCSARFKVFKEMPARGSELKSKISSLNELAKLKPVILLTDLDNNDCAPSFKKTLLNSNTQSEDFIINIAIDEAEAWLMADRNGFSSYFGIPIKEIPKSTMMKMGGMKKVFEMNFSMKSSYVLTHQLASYSTKEEIKNQIMTTDEAAKGPEYNTAMLPFIKNHWNITSAMTNSDSLSRMVNRIKLLVCRFPEEETNKR